jgi:hypothetical protein
MDEMILGFQLRVLPDKLTAWDLQRRIAYLLREDIGTPLSVDMSVWTECKDSSLHSVIFKDFDSSPNTAPNGLSLYSFRDSSALIEPPYIKEACLVGVSALGQAAHELQDQRCIEHTFSIGNLGPNAWRCVGYDVADYWLLSGLSNCGYNASEKHALSKQFTSNLNEYGLFISVDSAQQFCANCNARIYEHAPFAVYGVWVSARIF